MTFLLSQAIAGLSTCAEKAVMTGECHFIIGSLLACSTVGENLDDAGKNVLCSVDAKTAVRDDNAAAVADLFGARLHRFGQLREEIARESTVAIISLARVDAEIVKDRGRFECPGTLNKALKHLGKIQIVPCSPPADINVDLRAVVLYGFIITETDMEHIVITFKNGSCPVPVVTICIAPLLQGSPPRRGWPRQNTTLF